jgi:dGTPase
MHSKLAFPDLKELKKKSKKIKEIPPSHRNNKIETLRCGGICMSIRENLERMEEISLSPFATLSVNSRGRDREEPQCDIRPVFQRDRDRILHCKSFRRLKHKTQVFLSPKGDHYRTRLTHTLEVSQNARTIAKALRLNEDLVEAIALGHDLGHTPFGHAGERILNELCEEGYRHNEQSVRIVEKLEKDGKGLNLTWEVRDGILNHQTSMMPHTLEGKIVRLSDKIAYINHDIDDAIRAKVMSEEDIPLEIRKVLGMTTKERLNTLIHNIIMNSMGKNDIVMSEEIGGAMQDLRKFMFQKVYTNPAAKGEEAKAERLLCELYAHYMGHIEILPEQYQRMHSEGEKKERVVCDYISGMTDQYAVAKYREFFLPKAWEIG